MQNYLKLTFYQKNAKTSQNYIPNSKQSQYYFAGVQYCT